MNSPCSLFPPAIVDFSIRVDRWVTIDDWTGMARTGTLGILTTEKLRTQERAASQHVLKSLSDIREKLTLSRLSRPLQPHNPTPTYPKFRSQCFQNSPIPASQSPIQAIRPVAQTQRHTSSGNNGPRKSYEYIQPEQHIVLK
ncbi:hypothetical protein L873DRAFT_1796170 [Choiromyces venosus 120613-1]|uniref:Uncharacterized protein n=1 Tax=Choiromyces venosus 120613-1 TaxID=1336337 RepID=A0A3N4IT18_9PEZI|nr:hypothetical protein L873DRAFT_1796170 [Choiromyces venosus 120613-1]